jgi:hypothetical protein
MKVKMYSSFLTAIALLFMSPVLSTHAQEKISLSHAANTSVKVSKACATAVGYWWWGNTRTFPVSIYANGRILADKEGERIKASWTCTDPDQGIVEIRWSTGYVDLMKVVDRNRMTGDNGIHEVNAFRRD